jgi:mannose/fructose/N-acetylgalactosamine-specific phosphotransferase system component IIC
LQTQASGGLEGLQTLQAHAVSTLALPVAVLLQVVAFIEVEQLLLTVTTVAIHAASFHRARKMTHAISQYGFKGL